MALGTPMPLLCDTASDVPEHAPSSLNVFEGPEKKLELHFKPINFASAPSCAGVQTATNVREQRASSPHTNTSLVSSQSLRTLSPSEIQSILDEAACTVLSVMSNEHTDAYLLSESSLFVSDLHLTIKTCGTTRLLHALPVVLKLASERLALVVTFENEVSFLDNVLNIRGQVFEASSKGSPYWHLYFAELETSHEGTSWAKCPEEELIQTDSTPARREALEICMFDLDPSVMKLFMFHDKPSMIGTDSVRSGTTKSAGITRLLLEDAMVDAFNFEPCGYSMNALVRSSYYTIHVSPEPDASYVSFETTVPQEHLTQLISSVVKLFKPGHFTVALIHNARTPHVTPGIESSFSWPILSKLLMTHFFRGEEPSLFTGEHGCQAMVASFSSSDMPLPVTTTSSILNSSHDSSGIDFHLSKVATAYGARFIRSPESHVLPDPKPGDGTHPTFVVDLGRVAANTRRIRRLASAKRVQLRYTVCCNSDEAILALLSNQDISFEVTTGAEITLLQRVGVPRERMVLVTPMLLPSVLTLFDAVGAVVLFGEPSDTVLKALKRTKVDVEIRVGLDNFADLDAVLSSVLSVTTSICSIGIDAKHGKNCPKRCDNEPLGLLLTWIGKVQRSLDLLPGSVKETATVQVGEFLWNDMAADDVLSAEAVQGRMRTLLSHTPLIGIDVSRLVVGNSVSLITEVIGRRCRRMGSAKAENGEVTTRYNYYLNDGVYGALSCVLMEAVDGRQAKALRPRAEVGAGSEGEETRLKKQDRDKRMQEDDGVDWSEWEGEQGEEVCTLFGPTCDALDRIWVGKLPVLKVGDRVVFGNMGAYSLCGASTFNGFGQRLDTSYVVSRANARE